MITIDYTISREWSNSWKHINLATASITDLTFKVLLGDITFVVDSVDLSACWGWIPIIDFAAAMLEIANKLTSEDLATFEFTENDANLRFFKRGADIEITASYHPGKIAVRAEELISALRRFATRLGSELVVSYPDLKLNAGFRELFSIA